LIIVTPEIVRPMDPDQVPPMPGWYVTHPNDYDLYKYNRIEGNPDLGNYELLPYGNGQGYGQDVGFSVYEPTPQYVPSRTLQLPPQSAPTMPSLNPYDESVQRDPSGPQVPMHSLPAQPRGLEPIQTDVSASRNSD